MNTEVARWSLFFGLGASVLTVQGVAQSTDWSVLGFTTPEGSYGMPFTFFDGDLAIASGSVTVESNGDISGELFGPFEGTTNPLADQATFNSIVPLPEDPLTSFTYRSYANLAGSVQVGAHEVAGEFIDLLFLLKQPSSTPTTTQLAGKYALVNIETPAFAGTQSDPSDGDDRVGLAVGTATLSGSNATFEFEQLNPDEAGTQDGTVEYAVDSTGKVTFNGLGGDYFINSTLDLVIGVSEDDPMEYQGITVLTKVPDTAVSIGDLLGNWRVLVFEVNRSHDGNFATFSLSFETDIEFVTLADNGSGGATLSGSDGVEAVNATVTVDSAGLITASEAGLGSREFQLASGKDIFVGGFFERETYINSGTGEDNFSDSFELAIGLKTTAVFDLRPFAERVALALAEISGSEVRVEWQGQLGRVLQTLNDLDGTWETIEASRGLSEYTDTINQPDEADSKFYRIVEEF